VNDPVLHQFLADLVLLIHFGFVVFVVLGFGLIVADLWRDWAWVESKWFRLIHLVAIVVVVLQAWLGRACPLTAWENALRQSIDDAGYSGTFVQHWLHKILYFQAPSWVFTLVYTVFAALVVLVWVFGKRIKFWLKAEKNSCNGRN